MNKGKNERKVCFKIDKQKKERKKERKVWFKIDEERKKERKKERFDSN